MLVKTRKVKTRLSEHVYNVKPEKPFVKEHVLSKYYSNLTTNKVKILIFII